MIDEIFEQEGVKDVFKAWDSAKLTKADVPFRRDFEPLNCPRSLADVWIYERVEGAFICRLAGENVSGAWGKRILGKDLVDVIGEGAHLAAVGRLNRVLDRSEIVHGFHNQSGKPFVRKAERFYAPLKNANGENSHVLGVSHYYDTKEYFGDSKDIPIQRICDFICYYDASTYELVERIDL